MAEEEGKGNGKGNIRLKPSFEPNNNNNLSNA